MTREEMIVTVRIRNRYSGNSDDIARKMIPGSIHYTLRHGGYSLTNSVPSICVGLPCPSHYACHKCWDAELTKLRMGGDPVL